MLFATLFTVVLWSPQILTHPSGLIMGKLGQLSQQTQLAQRYKLYWHSLTGAALARCDCEGCMAQWEPCKNVELLVDQLATWL